MINRKELFDAINQTNYKKLQLRKLPQILQDVVVAVYGLSAEDRANFKKVGIRIRTIILNSFSLIEMEMRGESKTIAVMVGNNNAIKTLSIKEMEELLISCDISSLRLNQFRKLQYGDGTTDGTGDNAQSAREFYGEHQAYVKSINNFLESKKMEIINAVFFEARGKKIDGILHIDSVGLEYISTEELCRYIKEVKTPPTKALKCSVFSVQTFSRNIERGNEKVQFKLNNTRAAIEAIKEYCNSQPQQEIL